MSGRHAKPVDRVERAYRIHIMFRFLGSAGATSLLVPPKIGRHSKP